MKLTLLKFCSVLVMEATRAYVGERKEINYGRTAEIKQNESVKFQSECHANLTFI